jgi:hypothetical protein
VLWPAVTEQTLAAAAERGRASALGVRRDRRDRAASLKFLGSILVPADETVLCFFDGVEEDVRSVSGEASVQFERVFAFGADRPPQSNKGAREMKLLSGPRAGRWRRGAQTRLVLIMSAVTSVLLAGLVVIAPTAHADLTDPTVTNHDTRFDDTAPRVPENAPGVTFMGDGVPPNGNSLCAIQSGQWTYVRNTDNTVSSDVQNKVVEGAVVYSKLSTDDNPFNHDSRDRNIIVYPDPAYWGMLAEPGNFHTGESNEWGRMELEWEAAAMPAWVLPNEGDHVHVQGNYIFDCAHENYRTEIHPPRLIMTLRDAAQGFSGTTVVGAPRPGWADTMPGLGSIPVQTSRADVFASSDGGEACDTVFCPLNNSSPYNDAYQPLNDSNYDLFVPAPPKPDGNYQMIWTVDKRPLPSCFSDDSDCGMDDILANHPERIHFAPETVGGQAGLGIHIDFANYTPNSNGLYGFGFTVKVAWNKPADTPPRRVRVTLDDILVANPMDGSPPLGCISFAEFCDGQFAIHAIIGDTFKHLRLCCASSDTSDNTHQDVPYSEDVNNYLYKVDGTSGLCGLASAGNPDGNQCQNSFEVTLLPGQPLRIFLRGDEWEAVTNICGDTGCGIDNATNKDVGVVEHIFTGDPLFGSSPEESNYGIGGGVNHDGHYSEWFQDRLSAGLDNVNGYCTPPNSPCLKLDYHIDDDPYPMPPTASVSAVGSPSAAIGGVNWITSASTITLTGQAPTTRPGDSIELHARYWRTGTTAPADSICDTATGTATCNLNLNANDGADGTYTVEFFSVDTTDGAIGATKDVSFNLDNTAPTTTSSLAGTLVRGWYNTPVAVTLSGDDGTGVGVDHTTYAVDGGAAATYAAPFVVSGDSAAHSVTYNSVDRLQNIEPSKSVAFKIDTTPPSLNITSASDGTFTYSEDDLVGGMFTNATSLSVAYAASDALSGLYQVRLDGHTLTNSSGTFTLTLPPGISNHDLVAEDVAGNLTTLSFPVVSIPPGTFSGGVSPQGYGFWKNAVANGAYTNEQMATFLAESDIASHIFGRPVNRYPDITLATYQTILQFPPSSNTDQKVERALLVVWLNFMSGREPAAQPIDVSKVSGWQTVVTNTGGSPNTTALNLVRETERRLTGSPSLTVLSTIQTLLENLTEGRLNS